MADDQLTFILAARDNASATLNKVSRELRGLGPAAGQAAGPMAMLGKATGGLVNPITLAAAGIAGTIAFLSEAAQAAMEDEASVALLTTAIRENDAAMVGHIGAIEEEISARMWLAFSDEEQRSSLGALVALTKDSTKALELQRVAMDLARLKGMDLEAATTLLGKVYGGNIGILARYGIQLAKGTTATEAIAEIQRRAAGQAEAYAETTAGSMEAAGIAFSELQEEIGRKLMPALRGLSQWLLDEGIPALEKMVGLVDTLAPVFERFWVQANPGPEMADTLIAMDRAAHGGSSSFDALAFSARKTAEAFLSVGGALADGAPEVAAGVQILFDPVQVAADKAKQQAVESARALTGAYADELASGADLVEQGWEDLLSGAANEQTKAQRIATVNAKLTSAELTNALASEDPYLRAQAIAYRETLETELATLTSNALYQAWLTGKAIPDALNDAQAAAATAAQGLRLRVAKELELNAYPGGVSIGKDWITGIAAGITSNTWIVSGKIAGVEALLGSSLPTKGPLTHPERGGRSIGEAWSKGIGEGIKGDMLDGFRMPGMSGGYAMAGANGGRGAGLGLIVNFTSTFPPTPAQAADIAGKIGPELERWRRRNGFA